MRTAIAIFTLIAAAAFARAADMVEFKSEEKNFSIKHPADWKPGEANQSNMVVRFISAQDGEQDAYREELSIKVLDMNQEADINELVDGMKPEMAKRLTGYVEKSDEKVIVAGRPARKIVSEVATQFSPVRSTQWFVIDGTRLYIITLNALPTTAEQYKPYGDAMVDSFTIAKK